MALHYTCGAVREYTFATFKTQPEKWLMKQKNFCSIHGTDLNFIFWNYSTIKLSFTILFAIANVAEIKQPAQNYFLKKLRANIHFLPGILLLRIWNILEYKTLFSLREHTFVQLLWYSLKVRSYSITKVGEFQSLSSFPAKLELSSCDWTSYISFFINRNCY